MGNRSRFAAAAGVAVGAAALRAVARARRRARLRAAAEGIADAIMPTVAAEVPTTEPVPVGDEAHAPGHSHLPLTGDLRIEPLPAPVLQRPFAKQRHGLRHPGRG